LRWKSCGWERYFSPVEFASEPRMQSHPLRRHSSTLTWSIPGLRSTSTGRCRRRKGAPSESLTRFDRWAAHVLVEVGASQLLQLVLEDGAQVAFGRNDAHADAKTLPIEIRQVIEQHLHPRAASYEHAGSRGDSLTGIEILQVMGRELNGVERAPHVMAEDSQQQIARPFLCPP